MSKVNDINNITLPVYKRLKKEIDDNPVIKRFNKVYVDELPADVQEWLDAHFVDADRKITLTKEEMNNYTWLNLKKYLDHTEDSYSGTTVVYNEITLNYSGISHGQLSYYLSNPFYAFTINYSSSKCFNLAHNGQTEVISHDILLNLSSDTYNNFKSAIVKDLLANLGYQLVDSSNVVDEKIETAVGNIDVGIKLYKHSITKGTYTPGPGITSDYGMTMIVISTRSSQYTQSTLASDSKKVSVKIELLKINQSALTVLSSGFGYDGNTIYPMGVYDNSGTAGVVNELANANSKWQPLAFTDTVTEL